MYGIVHSSVGWLLQLAIEEAGTTDTEAVRAALQDYAGTTFWGPTEWDQTGKNVAGATVTFQIQDDALGIWGNPDVTGKSIASDLLARKNTLPILFGLQNCDEFREMWQAPETTPDCLKKMSDLLDSCGAREFVRHYAEKFTNDAFQTLEALFPLETPENKPAQALFELSSRLLGRNL